ncbi:MAG TPA: glycerophosphodiester phosphodiesterase family protein [Pseudolysinimonas sp.]|nr:glycerophosphodiester phosphodiesterase family protein [Pseudolysinimonas sp.]
MTTSPPKTLVIGHRGASGYRPEHTRSAYLLAFEQGTDAVEPDVVASRDGVLVIRHENEISGTTDVADHPEFAGRRTSKVIDGVRQTGWFTEDFTWDELSTLRAIERLPQLRPASAEFDRTEPILRLRDLLTLVDEHAARTGRTVRLVVEVKHASYFASIGLPLDELLAAELGTAGRAGLVIESFEPAVLGQLRARGIRAEYVVLFDDADASAALELNDLTARVGNVDGISVPKALLLAEPDLVAQAHARGLLVFVWTLRPENRFLARLSRIGPDPAAWGDWQREFGEVIASGVDGIFVDHPDLGIAARERQGPPVESATI